MRVAEKTRCQFLSAESTLRMSRGSVVKCYLRNQPKTQGSGQLMGGGKTGKQSQSLPWERVFLRSEGEGDLGRLIGHGVRFLGDSKDAAETKASNLERGETNRLRLEV